MKILRIKRVLETTGLSKSAIYQIPDFPRPIKLTDSGKCVGWLESEVMEWLQRRIAASRSRSKPTHGASAPS